MLIYKLNCIIGIYVCTGKNSTYTVWYSVVSGIHWGSWDASPADKGGNCNLKEMRTSLKLSGFPRPRVRIKELISKILVAFNFYFEDQTVSCSLIFLVTESNAM